MMGGLADSSAFFPDAEELAARLAADGYLFLRGLYDIVQALAARAEVFGRLEAVARWSWSRARIASPIWSRRRAVSMSRAIAPARRPAPRTMSASPTRAARAC